MAAEDDVFPFGREGCSHFGPDLYVTLRVSAVNASFNASVQSGCLLICQSVSWSVRQSVSWLVGKSVSWSVNQSVS